MMNRMKGRQPAAGYPITPLQHSCKTLGRARLLPSRVASVLVRVVTVG